MQVLLVCAIATVAVTLTPAPVQAADVYERIVLTNGTATGALTWTNTAKYVAVDLKRIWVERSLSAADTVTVKRVTSGGSFTQAVGTVTVAASVGNTSSFTAEYLKGGDMLTFLSTATTGSVIVADVVYQNP